MEFQTRELKIMQLIQRRNLLTVGLALSVLLNLIQAITVTNLLGKNRVVLVPPEIKEPFWVSSSDVSHEYLQQMTDYYLTLILNVTPETAAVKRELLLKCVHPSGYGSVKEQLISEESEIRKRQISRFFVPISYEVNNTEHWVKALGDLTILVGQQKVSVERVEYRIQYQLEAGRLLIEAFSEEPQHEPT